HPVVEAMPRDGSRQKDSRVDQGQRYSIGYRTLPAPDPHAPSHRGHRRREQVREKGREQREDARTLNGSHHAGNTLQDRVVVTRATQTRDVRAPSKPPTPRTVRAVGTPVFVSGSVGSAVLLRGSVPLEESIDGR